uniref:Uncharacterized protein n=1 Tax=Setaria digitata TaxID=48799 RepID=A0A915Q1N8_9BILA
MSLSSTPFSHQGYSSDVSSEYYCIDSNETECLEHYETNLEKYKGVSHCHPKAVIPSEHCCVVWKMGFLVGPLRSVQSGRFLSYTNTPRPVCFERVAQCREIAIKLILEQLDL